MKSIKLKSGKILDCISVFGKRIFTGGSERDCLIFNFKDSSADELLKLFKDTNETAEITIYSGAVPTNTENTDDIDKNIDGCIYYDYSIFVNLEIKKEIIQKEDNQNAEESISMLSVAMGQVSYSEKLEKERNTQLDNISEVIADILGGAL